MKESLEKTKTFWSKRLGAKLYRAFAGKYFSRMHKQVAEQVLSVNPKDVLDIACGPGDFLFYLSNVAPKLNLTGADIAPGMVNYAKEKLLNKATILESDVENLPFSENSFDAITIMMAFHHFPKKLETLGNIKKILRKNGVLIIADVVATSSNQKKLWNILERLIGVRGPIEHYTDIDLKENAEKLKLTFSIQHISGMPKRYSVCKLVNNS
jgi:ubiquinone/menaquinone biosynthesis C-methylase UbiE